MQIPYPKFFLQIRDVVRDNTSGYTWRTAHCKLWGEVGQEIGRLVRD